jgi:hypothetical protein
VWHHISSGVFRLAWIFLECQIRDSATNFDMSEKRIAGSSADSFTKQFFARGARRIFSRVVSGRWALLELLKLRAEVVATLLSRHANFNTGESAP